MLGGIVLAAAAATRPNVLLLLPDEWRYDWDGLTQPTSGDVPLRVPTIKSLAEKGTRFTQAYVAAPVCAPSRSCIAAGREYDRTQVPSNGQDFNINMSTFYGLLREGGYHTMTAGKDDLTKQTQLGFHNNNAGCPDCKLGDGRYHQAELGFVDGLRYSGKMDVIQEDYPHEMYGFYLRNISVTSEKGNTSTAWDSHKKCLGKGDGVCDNQTYYHTLYEDDYTAANAVALLKRRPMDKPFFMQVNFPGPHPPFLVTASMRAKVSDGRKWPVATDDEKGTTPGGACDADGEPVNQEVRCNYAAEIENLDYLFSLVLDEVKAQGVMDNTLVIITSDHGEMLGDHGDTAKSKPWQGSLSVPLIFSGPGVAGKRVVSTPVGNMDVAGTVLDVAGLKPDSGMTTQTLRNLYAPDGDGSYRDYVQSGLNDWRLVVKHEQGSSWKFICCKGKCPGSPSTAPAPGADGWMRMLINVDEDPFDMKDLSGAHPDKVKELAALLPNASYSYNGVDYAAGCGGSAPVPLSERSGMSITVQHLGSFEASFGAKLNGMVVTAVTLDSATETSGVTPGWRVTKVNSLPVQSAESLAAAIENVPMDASITVDFDSA